MAVSKQKYSVGSPQEHVQLCKNHDLPIDLVCEDCDEFICSSCAKTDHNKHNWITLGVAASQRRKGLLKFFNNIKEEKLANVDERIAKKMAENERTCESQRKNLKKHFDEIIAKLTDIRERKEESLKNNLRKKNEQLTVEKSRINKKQKQIIEIMKYIEENKGTMSDKNLIENHRDLEDLLALDIDIGNSDYSVRYKENVINDEILESLFGDCFDLDNICATETNSFQYVTSSEDGVVLYLETLNENECYVHDMESDNVYLVNKQGEKKQAFDINGLNVRDMSITNNGIFFTTKEGSSIRCLSSSGSISTILSTDAVNVEPVGISNSVDGGLLVSFIDSRRHDVSESDFRRLVKHLTLTGDIIHEYEYEEDGHTRLFTVPGRLCQNNNTDICVLNRTDEYSAEVVILSLSGRLQFVYRGQNLKDFFPQDLVCDSACNILVTDLCNSVIHLLSPEGEFLKFLLTEKEVTHPLTLSLYKSALWVGINEGLVKVFNYKNLP